MKNFLLLIVMIFGITTLSSAQVDTDQDGEIQDALIEIVKDRDIKLSKADRNFSKIPPTNLQLKEKKVEYSYNAINFKLPDLKIRVRPLKMRDSAIKKLYGNYVKAGFGNFTTPYLEGYFSNKRSKQYTYGAHFNFINSSTGPIDDENSGSGRWDIDLFGKLFSPKTTLSGDIGFNRRNTNFYGYPEGQEVDSDSIAQNFNNFYFKTSIENTKKKEKFDYLFGLQFDYLTDNFDATESEVQLDFRGEYSLGENSGINFDTDLDLITRKDEGIETKNRNIFRVTPTFNFTHEGFLIEAGFNAVYENDTLGNSDELHFYPVAKATYKLSNGFNIYAGLRGDVQKNSLRRFVAENPFLNPNVAVFNTEKSIELYGGVEGKLSSKMGFGAGWNLTNYKNMYFYLNDFDDQSRFNIIYDTGDTRVFNLFGELSYNKDEKLRINLRGDYYGYSLDNVQEAWHKPNYRISTAATYNLYDKLYFSAELYALGGIKALDTETLDTIDLDAAFDLNLKVDYKISDQFSIFARFNNIFSQEYELLSNYPSRSLQFMLGAAYNF